MGSSFRLAFFLALSGLAWPCGAQDGTSPPQEPVPPKRTPPEVEWTDERSADQRQQPTPEGEDQAARQARGEVPADGVQEAHPIMEGLGNLRPHVFPDPDPLPQGGKGFLYFNLNVPADRFIAHGPGETVLKGPSRVGPLTFGQVEWPAPTGTYRHPKSGTAIPGWSGQLFLKMPVRVDAAAPLDPVLFKMDYQFRLLMADPPATSMTHNDPFDVRLAIGPPLPQVQIPPRTARNAAQGDTPPRPVPKKDPSGVDAAPSGPAQPRPRPAAARAPGNPLPDPELNLPLPSPPSGFFGNAPLILGGAGILALLALLLLFGRKR